jgi:hypothetical protein
MVEVRSEGTASSSAVRASDVVDTEKAFIDALINRFIAPSASNDDRKSLEEKLRNLCRDSFYGQQTWDAFINSEPGSAYPMLALLKAKIDGLFASVSVDDILGSLGEARQREWHDRRRHVHEYLVSIGYDPKAGGFTDALEARVKAIWGDDQFAQPKWRNPWREMWNPYIGGSQRFEVIWGQFFIVSFVSIGSLYVAAGSLRGYEENGYPGLFARFWENVAYYAEASGAIFLVASVFYVLVGRNNEATKMWGTDSAWLGFALLIIIGLIHHSALLSR